MNNNTRIKRICPKCQKPVAMEQFALGKWWDLPCVCECEKTEDKKSGNNDVRNVDK